MISGGWNPFGFVKKLVKPAIGAIGGFATGGPAGAIAGGIGGALDSFGGGGGGGGGGYVSPYTRQNEDAYQTKLMERLGKDSKPLTGQSGVEAATSGYDLSPIDQAIKGYQNPSQFNFQNLPQQYGSQMYERAAGDIRREGSGALEQARQSVGARRPGLLSKVATDYGRQQGQNLAGLRTDIGLERMRQDVQLGKEQQLSQADENARGLQGLERAGLGRAEFQRGALGDERNYRDRALEYLQNQFATTSGLQLGNADVASRNRTSTLGELSGLADSAGRLGGIFRRQKQQPSLA